MSEFVPDAELVTTHRLRLESGEAIVFDQSLWGKVIEVRELHVDSGRYFLDDYLATAPLRQLLEASTVGGEWAFTPDDPLYARIHREVRILIERLYGTLD